MYDFLRRLWHLVVRAPDERMLELGAGGELLVARVRVSICGLIVAIPLAEMLYYRGFSRELAVGLLASLSALGLAMIVHWRVVVREIHSTWIFYATSALDVTLVSVVLCVFLLLGEPLVAVNSKVVWEIYLLAIAATTLRVNTAVCLFAGLLSMSEYLAILLTASSQWNLNSPTLAPFVYGLFDWGTQIGRLTLMLAMTVLAIAVAGRTRAVLELATWDPLTGVFSRGYFDMRLRQEVERALRYRRRLTLAIMELNNLRVLNRRLGRAAGDRALRRLAANIRTRCRATDSVFRIAGGRLAILFPESDSTAVFATLREIEEATVSEPLSHTTDYGTSQPHISIGVATIPEDGSSEEALIDAAEEHLQAAVGDTSPTQPQVATGTRGRQ